MISQKESKLCSKCGTWLTKGKCKNPDCLVNTG